MKVDAHQHFWQYNPVDYEWISESMSILKQDRLPADVLPLLQQQGFDAVVAVQARQTESETDLLLALAAQYDFIKAVVGWVDLQSNNLEARLQYYQQFEGLKGFRHIVQDEPDERFLLQKQFINGVKLLSDFDFTYDILVYEKHLPVVLQFLEHFDNQPFVLDHIGKPDIKQPIKESWKNAMYALAQYPHLYCKISGLVTEANWHDWKMNDFKPFLGVIFDAFGVERVMVGSDWPVCLLAAPDYASVIGIVENFTKDFSISDKQQIFGENASQFYKIGE
jgi:L-fuconolactonase